MLGSTMHAQPLLIQQHYMIQHVLAYLTPCMINWCKHPNYFSFLQLHMCAPCRVASSIVALKHPYPIVRELHYHQGD